MKTIVTWNLKGGVGKTTLTFNLAANLAKAGYRVLCLDLDPQANLTSFFEKDILKHKERPDLVSLVSSNAGSLKGSIYSSHYSNLHFVKGSNTEIQPKYVDSIKKILDKETEKYDVCFIDCHPDFSFASQAALYASDLILVPIAFDGFSRDNLNLVVSNIQLLEEMTFNAYKSVSECQ